MTMKTFEEKYLYKIKDLFEKYKGKMEDPELNEILERGMVSSTPRMNAEILICGINPSDNKDTPHTFEFMKTTNKYFRPIHEITDACLDKNKIDYIYLFCFRRRNQNDIWRFTNDPVGIKFISEHLVITQQIIEEMHPNLILVFNKTAATFFGRNAMPEAERVEDKNIWMGYSLKKTETDNLFIVTGLQSGRINEDMKKTNLESTKVYFSKYLSRFVGKEEMAGIKEDVSELIIKTLV